MNLRILLLAAATLVLYASLLERSPIYLNNDEAAFAVQAHAIATTARDDQGRLLPLYFNMLPSVWYQPVIVYAIALTLTVLPLNETVVRLPTVLVALADVVLVVVVARRIFRNDRAAIAAGALLALTPAHFIHGRLACDYLYPLPFVLTWLWCLTSYADTQQPRRLFLGGLALGAGFYSYIASVVMMPLYVAMSGALIAAVDDRPARRTMLVIAGFALALVPLALWLPAHPDVVTGTIARYRVHTDIHPGIVESVRERLVVYLKFFDPLHLFVRDFGAVTSSTHRAGVFAVPMLVFLPAGIVTIVRHRRRALAILIVAGFFAAPLAATIVNEPYTTDRALALLPFGALLGGVGVDRLLSSSGRAVRSLAIALLAAIPLQFAYFYADYMTGYRIRSAFWFNGNNRGMLEEVIAEESRDRPRPVYLADNIPFIRFYVKFYLIKHHREDLIDRWGYFTPADLEVDRMPVDSIILTNADDSFERQLLASGRFREVKKIVEADGTTPFARLAKQ
jgi:4-amino-4-deoxy-L-arabinose transferase-like glycosyltransferase